MADNLRELNRFSFMVFTPSEIGSLFSMGTNLTAGGGGLIGNSIQSTLLYILCSNNPCIGFVLIWTTYK